MKPPSHQPRIGFRGYARVLHSMPGTPYEISERCCIAAEGVRRICREMLTLKLAHRSGIKLVGIRNSKTPIYSFGPGENVPMPQSKDRSRPRAKLIAFASVARMLTQPTSVREMVEESGVSMQAAWALMRYMRKIGMARICGHTRTCGGQAVPMWVFGSAPNAGKPPPRTRKKVNADYYRRQAQARTARRIMVALAPMSSVFTIASNDANRSAA